jgi:tRNA modification GTPase
VKHATPSAWAARLTPAGAGAIATIAVRGAGAWEVVRPLLSPSLSADCPLAGTTRLVQVGGATKDQVVLGVKQAGPEPWLELHCHGGMQVVAWLLELIEERGAGICSWWELEERFSADPLRVRAAVELSRAATGRTAAILLDQYDGAFARGVQGVLAALAAEDVSAARARLEEMAAYGGLGRHLTRPWRVVVAGAANVGKSSLVNALAGYPRCLVSPLPGTTRDLVRTIIAVEGWPIELVDTAGWRDDAGVLEEQGLQQARETIGSADLCLWLLDAAAAPRWPPALSSAAMLPVINKIDLPPAWDFEHCVGGIRLSARTGAGLEDLCQALAATLVPRCPPPQSAVPFTPELAERVAAAARRLEEGDVAAARDILQSLVPGGAVPPQF